MFFSETPYEHEHWMVSAQLDDLIEQLTARTAKVFIGAGGKQPRN